MTHLKSFAEKPSPLVRPQSAVGSKHLVGPFKQTAAKGLRPWTAHPRHGGQVFKQKVIRQSQRLRQRRDKAVGRPECEAVNTVLAGPSQPSASPQSSADRTGLDVVTMVSSGNSSKSVRAEVPHTNTTTTTTTATTHLLLADLTIVILY